MKKVLILAWDFPPYTAIGGARPFSWYKHFKENGLEPIVVTRHWDADNNYKDAYIKSSLIKTKSIITNNYGIIIKVPYTSSFRDRLIINYGYNRFSLFRKFLSFSQFILSFPFFCFDNKKKIFTAAKAFLKNHEVDLILATGEPFILHKYAYLLSKKHNIPYVLDYRDGWTTRDDNLELSGIKKILNNFYFRSFERKYLSKAKFVITSNPFEQPKLKSIFPGTILKNVFNGYVEDEIKCGKKIKQLSDTFRIGYAGTIYSFNRVEDYLEGMRKFILKYPKAKFKLMLLGIENQPVQLKRIKEFDPLLLPFIESSPRMNKKDLINWFCKCNSLLVFTNPKIKLLPSKIYEYLPLKRKVLVSVNDKADLKMIMDVTNAGYNCNNSNEIYYALKEMYLEFIKKGVVSSSVKNYKQFSRKNQAKKLADFIHRYNF
ncbi:MAG: hypothetical protein CL827_02665 [Crocinitomicaceae bacterium]|nr:hypothetical protein [Crocinitomicaceae bacterium]|tara:strand:+ start:3599 stop:4891 length:1293 start_codon:yes stop_codon:yes gene_type:complete